jgi:hypothetical protein
LKKASPQNFLLSPAASENEFQGELPTLRFTHTPHIDVELQAAEPWPSQAKASLKKAVVLSRQDLFKKSSCALKPRSL